MKPTHTPGPWQSRTIREKGCSPVAVEYFRGLISNGPISEMGGITSGNEFIATCPIPENAERVVICVNAMEGIEDPIAARALLDDPRTAAATDLLAALKEAEHLVISYLGVCPRSSQGGVALRLHAIEKAIAKAEGKKS